MPDYISSVTADAAGHAVVTVAPVLSGVVWVVSQVSVEALTAQTSVTSVFRKNGRYITSSNQGAASTAGGAPAITIKSGDAVTMTWSGLSPGDTAILTLLYSELTWQDFNGLPPFITTQVV